ncbi:diaminopropionate ammonia-lyase [Maribellus maritimus]|uniref:diaminopropionate ammonia-lyase n=1 Tax=Maribellus maritimus TaxID=2870838 RepID=UPI001EECDA49|nr:diaminopropionate ammonia-lyase [Maribellus maritimus]MCG6190668.1 diaminopropionate ammonia-lyase [Maribellus maritimus]
MNSSFYINKPHKIIVNSITNSILEQNDAYSYHTSLHNYKPTPLIHLPNLSQKYHVGNIYIKDESFRFGLNAFKVLGASYAVNCILKEIPKAETFCTATDGNHGRAVAWSAKKFGKKAIVFVPKTTTEERIKAIQKEGATVIKVDGNYDYTCETVKNESSKNNWVLIQDTAWKNYVEIPSLIMAGYLTLFKEMENSLHTSAKPKIDILIIQAGVGSLAGAAIYYYLKKYKKNSPEIVVVEPKEADGVLRSFKRNKISTSNGNSCTIMAGLNCETPSYSAWDLLKSGVNVSIRIDDIYAKQAIRELYYPIGSDPKIIAGESGAAGFAGFISVMQNKSYELVRKELNINENTNILFINTEGDTDKNSFNRIINKKNGD